MSRITNETNALGSFDYAYVDDVSGSSKGTMRLASISYPNGQATNFAWYGNIGDQRLMSINNLAPSSVPMSQFSYGYDSAGEITRWGQQGASRTPQLFNLGYDQAGQLTTAVTAAAKAPPLFPSQYNYAYDSASNRTGVQTTVSETARLAGTVTIGDVLTINVNDASLSGGTEAVTYTAISGDSLSTMATKLAANITADSNLQAIGVDAAASGSTITIRANSPNVTSFSASTSGGATETIALGVSTNAVQNVTISGTVTTSDVLTIDTRDAALSGGHSSVSYTAALGNTTAQVASGLASAINADTSLSTAGITATASSSTVHISSTSSNLTTFAVSESSGATEVMSCAINLNSPKTCLVGGSKTTADVVSVNVYDLGLSGGKETVNYTVTSGDSISSIPSNLASAINADANLQAIGASASASGSIVTLNSVSPNVTRFTVARSSGATETLTLDMNSNGTETLVVGGTKTTGNVLTVNVFDAGLSGGIQAVSYTTLSGDNLVSIATAVAAAINANANLSGIGVTATSSATEVNINSASQNATTYTTGLSSGATETLALGAGSAITQAAFNNVNELLSISPGGPARFKGSTNKAIGSASVASQVVSITASPSDAATGYSSNVAGVPAAPMVLTPDVGTTHITITGTPTGGDVYSLTVTNQHLAAPATISYTVLPGDNAATVIARLQTAMFTNVSFSNYNVYGAFIDNVWNVLTTDSVLTGSVTTTAKESLALSKTASGTLVTVTGTPTTNEVVSLTVQNPVLPSGQKTETRSVTGGDTLTSIATALTSSLNADTDLQAIGVSATSSGVVITIAQALTTYTSSTSGGATETISFGTNTNGNINVTISGKPTTGDTLTVTAHDVQLAGGQSSSTYTVGSSDGLVDIASGLAAAINSNSALQALGLAATNSTNADLSSTVAFSASETVPAGSGTANVSAVDGASNTKTNPLQLAVNGGSGSSLIWDGNGNLTSDGTNSFAWDCENRLIRITYPGSGNFSSFVYDGSSRNVGIVETTGGTVSSTKQFIYASTLRCEERDASGAVTKQFFKYGQINSITKYFYAKDHLGSIIEMTDATGTRQAEYSYDPSGRPTAILENVSSDFKYARTYSHARSGLNVAVFRMYNSNLGRWLNRDPIGEAGGDNLALYADNNPISNSDFMGLQCFLTTTETLLRPTRIIIRAGTINDSTVDPMAPFVGPNYQPGAPDGSQGNPKYDCCKTQACCGKNASKCKDGCDYWYGEGGAAEENPGYGQRCRNCCDLKAGDCGRSLKTGGQVGFSACFAQGPWQPNKCVQA